MQIKTPAKKMNQRKELKVKLPVQQHLQLHALKLMTGQNISDSVREALEGYLGEVMGGGSSDEADASDDQAEQEAV